MKTVLIIDDSAMLRESISFVLKNAGYNVVIAENGKDALDKLNVHDRKIDIVITDLNMPVMNGIEFIKQMRGISIYKTIPVVLMTTELHEIKKQEAIHVDINEWIYKPFTPRQIKDIVKKFLK